MREKLCSLVSSDVSTPLQLPPFLPHLSILFPFWNLGPCALVLSSFLPLFHFPFHSFQSNPILSCSIPSSFPSNPPLFPRPWPGPGPLFFLLSKNRSVRSQKSERRQQKCPPPTTTTTITKKPPHTTSLHHPPRGNLMVAQRTTYRQHGTAADGERGEEDPGDGEGARGEGEVDSEGGGGVYVRLLWDLTFFGGWGFRRWADGGEGRRDEEEGEEEE